MFMLHKRRPSFSLSYGCILPSSLTRVLPRTLVFSTRLPVSVYGTGPLVLTRNFSRQSASLEFGSYFYSPICHFSAFCITDLPVIQPTGFDALFQQCAQVCSCVIPSLNQTSGVQEFLPVVHRLRSLPRLRSRLTLGRRSLPRKP